jgi:3-dehydroquinate synthase
MNIAGEIAIEKGLWSKEELKRQKNLLKSYALPTEIPLINKEDVLTILMGDKKVRDGKMRFILPKEIGEVDIYDDVDDSLFLKFFS